MTQQKKYVAKRDYRTRQSVLDSYQVQCADSNDKLRTGTIYRRSDSSSQNFQLRFYLREEKIYIRKSLGTAVHKEAVAKAQREIQRVLQRVEDGQRYSSPSILSAISKYLDYARFRVQHGDKAQQGLKIVDHQIKQVVRFINATFPQGVKTKINSIDGKNAFKGYYEWRCEYRKKVLLEQAAKRRRKNRSNNLPVNAANDKANEQLKPYTTNLELQGFRKVLKHAAKEGLCGENNYPPVEHQWQRKSRRPRIQSDDDYVVVLTGMRRFSKTMTTEKDKYYYSLLRHFFLTMAFTGARAGEIFSLKNRDCDINRQKQQVRLMLKTTKTDPLGGVRICFPTMPDSETGQELNYLIRWIDDHQKFKGKDDYLFSTYTNGASTAKYEYYNYYGALRKFLIAQGGEYERCAYWDTYHNRHRYITRLIAGNESADVIALAVGNSGETIRKTYLHLQGEMAALAIDSRRRTEFIVERAKRNQKVLSAEAATLPGPTTLEFSSPRPQHSQ
jgi:integrase